MKANEKDHNKYSDAIDRIQEGNDAMIELYNELEDDEPVIRFGQDVIENVEKAKKKYGDDTVDEKINTVVREMLSWLPLDEYVEEEEENDEEKEENGKEK
jgi:hypothetical protein